MTEFDRAEQNGFAAAVVRASTPGLAAAAAQRLLTEEAPVPVTGGADGFGQWKAALETHLGYLAAALSARRPAIFLEHARWTKWACAAREITTEELRASFTSLAEVLSSELPPAAAEISAAWVREAVAELDRTPEEPEGHVNVDATHGGHAARYLLSLLEGDRDASVAAIDGARADGVSIPEVYAHVIQPALQEIGRLWLLGEIHVVEEHFATATTSLVISRLFPDLPRRPTTGKTVMTVSVEGELHELGIRIVSDFFTMDGWKVIHLGASVPAPDLRQGVIDFGVDLVALSVSLPTHLEKATGIIAALRENPDTREVRVLVGGRALRGHGDLWREIGADGFAETADESVAVGRRLVGLDPSEG